MCMPSCIETLIKGILQCATSNSISRKLLFFHLKEKIFPRRQLTTDNGTTIGVTLIPDPAKHVREVDFLLFMELRIWTQKSYYDSVRCSSPTLFSYIPHMHLNAPREAEAIDKRHEALLVREMSLQLVAFHTVTSPEGIFSYVTWSGCCKEGCCLPFCNCKKPPSGGGKIQRRICKCADATLP